MPLLVRLLIALALVLSPSQDKAALTPEPDANVQKETLKKVKELFKDEYAKKAPADQQALGRKLLQNGTETSDDLVVKFVLLKEARDISVAAGDVETALRAADETSKSFAVDGAALKLGVLGKVVAKEPDAARAAAFVTTESLRAGPSTVKAAADSEQERSAVAQSPLASASSRASFRRTQRVAASLPGSLAFSKSFRANALCSAAARFAKSALKSSRICRETVF